MTDVSLDDWLEHKILVCEEDREGSIKGHYRTDWNIWVMAWLKTLQRPSDTPNPYYRGIFRGDFYIQIIVEDLYNEWYTINVPPFSVLSAEELAEIIDRKAAQDQYDAVQRCALHRAGADISEISEDEMLTILAKEGVAMEDKPLPSPMVGTLIQRIFAGGDQSSWAVEDKRGADD